MAPNIDRGTAMRSSFDAVNGTAAFGFIGAWLTGWTINEAAAAAALLYSLLLIADKAWSLIQRWRKPKA